MFSMTYFHVADCASTYLQLEASWPSLKLPQDECHSHPCQQTTKQLVTASGMHLQEPLAVLIAAVTLEQIFFRG